MAHLGNPGFFNTDRGSQSSNKAWTGVLKANDTQLFMDGKGCWVDNVYIERLWRTLKYGCVYLNAFEEVRDTRSGIGAWTQYDNEDRPHSSLQDRIPRKIYYELRMAE